MTAPSVLFYVQHLLGIGHLARASRIARAMVDAGLRVTLVTGGMPVPGFPAAGIPHVGLPPVAVADGAFKGLVDQTGTAVDQAFLDARRDLLLQTCRTCPSTVCLPANRSWSGRWFNCSYIILIISIKARPYSPRRISTVCAAPSVATFRNASGKSIARARRIAAASSAGSS